LVRYFKKQRIVLKTNSAINTKGDGNDNEEQEDLFCCEKDKKKNHERA